MTQNDIKKAMIDKNVKVKDLVEFGTISKAIINKLLNGDYSYTRIDTLVLFIEMLESLGINFTRIEWFDFMGYQHEKSV